MCLTCTGLYIFGSGINTKWVEKLTKVFRLLSALQNFKTLRPTKMFCRAKSCYQLLITTIHARLWLFRSASTSEPTQSLQKVTGFPSFSSRILATGAKEYLESSLVTLVKATNQWFVKWTNKICKNSKGRSTMIHWFMLFFAPFLVDNLIPKKNSSTSIENKPPSQGSLLNHRSIRTAQVRSQDHRFGAFLQDLPNFTATEKGRCWS